MDGIRTKQNGKGSRAILGENDGSTELVEGDTWWIYLVVMLNLLRYLLRRKCHRASNRQINRASNHQINRPLYSFGCVVVGLPRQKIVDIYLNYIR